MAQWLITDIQVVVCTFFRCPSVKLSNTYTLPAINNKIVINASMVYSSQTVYNNLKTYFKL